MLAVLLQTLPFFAIIGLGYWAGRARFLGDTGAVVLTRFVFWFALPAMLFGFAAELDMEAIFSGRLVAAYLLGTGAVYALAFCAALMRRTSAEEATVEAQCATIGNLGFMGIPMFVAILGAEAAGPVLLVLSVDIIVFGSLFTLVISGLRGSGRMLGTLARGLLGNPMVVSIVAGLAWSGAGLHVPAPVQETLAILGHAATPGALFAIGATLSQSSAERLQVAGWLSLCKLVLHPAAVAGMAVLLSVPRFPAAVMIACASLPVAGNVYMLAQAYGVAPQRASAAILLSTVASIITVTAVIALIAA